MKDREIGALVNAYLEGATDLAGEKRLKDFVLNEDCGRKYPELYGMFRFIELERGKYVHNGKRRNKRVVRTFLAAAVSAAILCLTTYFVAEQGRNKDFELIIEGRRVNDRDAALEIAGKSLAKINLMAEKLNASKKSLENMNGIAETASEEVKNDL